MEMIPTPEQRRRRASWLAELRSGKREQGRDFLKVQDRFCCLGVGCEILKDEDGIDIQENSGFYCLEAPPPTGWFPKEFLMATDSVFPGPVALLYGTSYQPTVVVAFGHSKDRRFELHLVTNLNDKGVSFEEIADHLEHNFALAEAYAKKARPKDAEQLVY